MVVECCDKGSSQEEDTVEDERNPKAEEEYRRVIRIGHIFLLDEGSSKPALYKDLGDRDEDHDQGDDTIVCREEQAREDNLHDELYAGHSSPFQKFPEERREYACFKIIFEHG